MKYTNLLIFCILFFGCSKTDSLYWCGDKPCRSIAEKNAYFKKTMTIEIKKSDKFDKIIKSNLELIKEQAGLEDKKINVQRKIFVKKNSSSEKRIIKNKKKLAKETRINKLKKIKKEKKLAKKSRTIMRKKKIKTEKQYRKKSSSKKYVSIKRNKPSSEFRNLLNKIIRRNAHKPYPNVNDIPN